MNMVITHISESERNVTLVMGYYVYENWTVKAGGVATVHRGNCRYCKYGIGTNKSKVPGRNGKWYGPFESRKKAWDFALSLGRKETRNCKIRYCLGD